MIPTDNYHWGRDGNPAYIESCRHLMNDSNRVMHAMLREVEGIVCGDRQDSYGVPEKNHSRTAEVFNWYLKHSGPTLDGRDVCLLNVLQKISRDLNCRKPDNLVDIAGYVCNAAACEAAEAVEI